ncbi:MAG: hypothetical protein MR802_05365 [Prevotella sp.]|nr:hypothetical protein [Prevotella sp.]
MAGDEHQKEIDSEQSPKQGHLVFEKNIARKKYAGYNAHYDKCIISYIDEVIDGNKEKEKEEQRSSSSYFRFAYLAVIYACH